MSVSFWLGLFDLRDAIDRATERAARSLNAAAAEGDATQRTALVLSSLHVEVRDLLERYVVSGLERHFTGAEVSRAVDTSLCLVSFWLNERIRRMLPPRDRADWEPVGPSNVDLRNGGRLFFLELDELLAELQRDPSGGRRSSGAEPPIETVTDVALFCLEQGFTGELATSARALQGYKERLRRPLVPGLSVVSEPPPSLAISRAPRIVAAVSACIAFYAVCVVVFGWVGGG